MNIFRYYHCTANSEEAYLLIRTYLCRGVKREIMGKKKIFSTRIDVDRLKALKHLAVDSDKSLGNLLEEAINDIVDKYEKKANSGKK